MMLVITDRRPRCLDLCCKAGGASRGYQLAGFRVTGVDHEPQKHYIGDEFVQADMFEYAEKHGREYDLIHASPPCQGYTELNHVGKDKYPKLISATHDLLSALGRPYIIENVRGAARELQAPVMLCGYMFGLRVYRHRYFECRPFVLVPSHLKHPEKCPPSGRGRSPKYGIISVTGNGGAPNLNMPYLDYARLAMGIDWTNRAEISEAIPPAYTEYLGRRMREMGI